VDPVLEIPPEFDPDSAEFISDISDYVTEYGKKNIVEIPIDFDTDAAELVSESRNSAAKSTGSKWKFLLSLIQMLLSWFQTYGTMEQTSNGGNWKTLSSLILTPLSWLLT